MSDADVPADVLDDAARDALLASLLRAHPGAAVAALDEFGRVVALPPSIDLGDQHRIETGTPFELVDASARVELLDAWVRARALGAARATVVLATGDAGVCHIIDLLRRHGVMVGMVVGDTDRALLSALANRQAVLPRSGRVHKDERGIITMADDSIAQILGLHPADMIGMRSLDLIHPEDQPGAIDAWIWMLTSSGGPTRLRARHRRSNGSWLWMELTNVNRLEHADGRVITDMADITVEMTALEALRHSEQLLRRLAEALPSGVLHVGQDRRVVYANAQLVRVVGVARADTVDQLLATVIPDDRGGLDAAIDRVLLDGSDVNLEVRIRLPDTAKLHLCTVAIRALTDAADAPDGAILCVDDVTGANELRAELQRRATVDDLTGCLNRATVRAELERILRSHRAGSRGTAVVYLDLDGFKAVNDTFGHDAGDRLLSSVVTRLNGVLREGDVVGRLGGDEFIVVLASIQSLDEAAAVGRRVEGVLREPLEVVGGVPMRIRASIGVAWSAATDISPSALTAAADDAMYRSKRAGASQSVLVSA